MNKIEYLSKEHIISNRIVSKIEIVGVYFLIKDNEIIYIGKTKSLFNRLKDHNKITDYDSYYFLPTDEIILDFEESKYILKYMPKLNKTISCAECTDLLGWYSRGRIIVQLNITAKDAIELDEFLKSKKLMWIFHKAYYNIENIEDFKIELAKYMIKS